MDISDWDMAPMIMTYKNMGGTANCLIQISGLLLSVIPLKIIKWL